MASVASLAFESQLSFSNRVAQLLDCWAACSEEEREAVFRLCYPAYLREGAVGPNFSGTFGDPTTTRTMRGFFERRMSFDRDLPLAQFSFRTDVVAQPCITPLEAPTTKSSISENISLFRGLRPVENTNHFSPHRLCER